MKKLLTLLFVITIVHFATAQDFPGDMPELLLGKTVTFKDMAVERQKYGYQGIYSDEDLESVYKKVGTRTPYAELNGKAFTIKSVDDVTKGDHKMYRVILENPIVGVLYYRYVPAASGGTYPFVVQGGLSYPEGFFCRDMKQQRFTAEGQTVAPPIDGIRVIKTPEAKGYSLALAINVATKDVALGDGAVIKLENGKTLSRPKQPIASNTNGSGGMVYTTFFELTKDDVALLREYKITEVQLYRHNHEIENGYTLREYLKCLDK